MGDTPVDSGLFWEKDKEEEGIIGEGIVEEDELSFIRRWCLCWCGYNIDNNKDNRYGNNNEDNTVYYNISVSLWFVAFKINEWIIKRSITWSRQGWSWWWWWEGRVLGRRHALGWGDEDKGNSTRQ